MRKLKYLLWLIILGVLVTFIYQNADYFMAEQRLGLDLYFFAGESGDIPNILYFLAVFVIGVLVSFIMTFSYGYKKRKTIRELKEKINADKKLIDEMESRLAAVEGTRPGSADTGSGAAPEKATDAEFSRA